MQMVYEREGFQLKFDPTFKNQFARFHFPWRAFLKIHLRPRHRYANNASWLSEYIDKAQYRAKTKLAI